MKTKKRVTKRGQNKAAARSLRFSVSLDSRLIKASELSGRSVSEEIAYRLDRSFRDDVISELVESGTKSSLVRLIHEMMTYGIELPAGKLMFSGIKNKNE